MKPSFPLYDTVFSKTLSKKDTPLSDEERNYFVEHIATIDEYELFYMLIRMHSLHNNNSPLNEIPYGGKQLKKGVRFELDSCPVHLQHILLEFIRIRRDEITRSRIPE